MSFAQIILTTIIASFLLTVIGAIRRLYFHPLSHIPGPKLAACTWWYDFYFDVIQGGRYVFKIQELHKQYGPIIRITPEELHINDADFLDTIYAPSSSRRDKYPYQLRSLRVPGGIGAAVSHEVHRKRREALAPFFSKRNVIHLEPLIKEKVEQLCSILQRHGDEKTPVNLSDAFFAFSNDVVTNFLFAHKVDTLADEMKAATLRKNSHALLRGIHVNKHLPWIPDFLESLPLVISRPLMPPGLKDLFALFERVRAEVVTIMNSKISDTDTEEGFGKQSVFASIISNPILPPAERSLVRLEQEGSLLVLAGTESPAHTLNIIFFHILANPVIFSKLQDEVNSVSEEATWAELEKLSYLTAVVEEGNRLSWGVTARMARVASENLTYTSSSSGKSYTIPAGTPVSTTTLSAHTSPEHFLAPFSFNPDRWLGDAGRERKKYQMAFGKGGRKCLGTELAKCELFLVTANLVKRFSEMRLWETGSEEVEFVTDFQVAMPNEGCKGVRIMVKP